jgi:hypothetical protein
MRVSKRESFGSTESGSAGKTSMLQESDGPESAICRRSLPPC